MTLQLTYHISAATTIAHTRLGASYRSPSPSHRRSESPASPRSPPGKVGTTMWGSHTPLGQKGVTPPIDAALWVCAVCYYTENPKRASKCAVCDSVNTMTQKVSLWLCGHIKCCLRYHMYT
jgi:hypothetical protein